MYQGARNVYCRYRDIKSKAVELVYDLTAKPLMFLDLGLVYPGMVIWRDRQGEPHPLHANVDYYGDTRLDKEDVVGTGYQVAHGVEFEAQPAQRGPVIEDIGGGTIMYEGGRYRGWMNARIRDAFKGLAHGLPTRDQLKGYDLSSTDMVLRYYESDDGIHWQAPPLNFWALDGGKTNVVYGSMFEPEKSFGGMTVFVDPSAPPEQRYKGMFGGRWPISRLAQYCQRRGIEPESMSLLVPLSRLGRDQFANDQMYDQVIIQGRLPEDLSVLPAGLPASEAMVFFGAVSPDGLHWTGIDEPVMPFMAETADPFYDVEKQQYVAYMRYWQYAQRRGIGISQTEDFHHWPRPRPLLCPNFAGYHGELGTDFYTSAHALYPGTTDVHLFFVSMFHHGTNDCVDLELAVSLDGEMFHFVPGGPVIRCDTQGWDPDHAQPAACIFPLHGMVPMGDDHVGIITREDNVPHKWPRTKQAKQTYQWALWENHRLVALHAPNYGQFTTAGLILTQRNIFINVKTQSAGFTKAMLLDGTGNPVPGYGRQESDAISGNHQRALLTWSGKSVPGELVGKKIYLAFEMSQARLFSISAGES